MISKRQCFVILTLLLTVQSLATNDAVGQEASNQPTHIRLATDYKFPVFDCEAPEFCYWIFPGDGQSTLEVLAVLDDMILYCDRNGNRDLTEPGERFMCEADSQRQQSRLRFLVDEIVVDEKVHFSTSLSVDSFERGSEKQFRNFSVASQIQTDRFQGDGVDGRVLVSAGPRDSSGKLVFGSSISDAPTINFLGDLQIRMSDEAKLRPGGAFEAYALVGTPGKGQGTFADIAYEGAIPENAYPTLTFKSDSESLNNLQYELKHRC